MGNLTTPIALSPQYLEPGETARGTRLTWRYVHVYACQCTQLSIVQIVSLDIRFRKAVSVHTIQPKTHDTWPFMHTVHVHILLPSLLTIYWWRNGHIIRTWQIRKQVLGLLYWIAFGRFALQSCTRVLQWSNHILQALTLGQKTSKSICLHLFFYCW